MFSSYLFKVLPYPLPHGVLRLFPLNTATARNYTITRAPVQQPCVRVRFPRARRPVHIVRIHKTDDPESIFVWERTAFEGDPPLTDENLLESVPLKSRSLARGLATSLRCTPSTPPPCDDSDTSPFDRLVAL